MSEIIKIVCLVRDQMGHVRPVQEWFGGRADFIYDADWNADEVVGFSPDLVVCINDSDYQIGKCVEACRRKMIPTLVLQDGVLEWRCQYENPLFASGHGAPQHQPVITDKIACIGPQSARDIARWGNQGKVEVAGMPRMDDVQTREFRPRSRPGRRVLVMTAKKPGFTPEQTRVTMRSLFDLKHELSLREDLEVIWRVTKGLHEELGVENTLAKAEPKEFVEILDSVDAVVTTPSTAMLESMLAGRPTAVLDYHNVPRFTGSAWTIATVDHMAAVIDELLDPPHRKLAFQEGCLHDSLYLEEEAAGRVGRLISAMVEWKFQADGGDPGGGLPANMLGYDMLKNGRVVAFGLDDLYPERQSFETADVPELQAMLARAESEIESLRGRLKGRKFGYWIERGFQAVRRGLGRGGAEI